MRENGCLCGGKRWCSSFFAFQPTWKVLAPSEGSSLRNPRSYRSRLRQAMQSSHQQDARFEELAMSADLYGSSSSRRSGSGEDDSSRATGDGMKRKMTIASSRLPRSKRQRRTHHRFEHIGKEVFEKAKFLSDSEWEGVPMDDKHAFTQYMSKMLREFPTQTTEQQRRRYFETTLVDPRSLAPAAQTVQDEYERIKLGLPVQMKHVKRGLAVPDAVYDMSDASLFDPSKSFELEEYMVQIKQVFADYVQHRREGRSTEAERRRLALMTREFHEQTQQHLGHMFKYAEETIRKQAHKERMQQWKDLEALKAMLHRKKKNDASRKKPQEGSAEEGKGEDKVGSPHEDDGKERDGLAMGEQKKAENARRPQEETQDGAEEDFTDAKRTSLFSTSFTPKEGDDLWAGHDPSAKPVMPVLEPTEGVPESEGNTDRHSPTFPTLETAEQHPPPQATTDSMTPPTSLFFPSSADLYQETANEVAHSADLSFSSTSSPLRRRKSSTRVKHFLRRALGIEPEVARSIWQELDAQLQFMAFCEVFARLTVKKGFQHTSQDEKLDAYTARLKKLYSVDAAQWSTLEVVQYLAAKEGTLPVEWARQWYERLLRIPLQEVPAYKRLEAMREEEVEAVKVGKESSCTTNEKEDENARQREGKEGCDPRSSDLQDHDAREEVQQKPNVTPDASFDKDESDASASARPKSSTLPLAETLRTEDRQAAVQREAVARGLSSAAINQQKGKVIRLVEKMFLRPEDPRLETLQEKRLRYLAYVQMEEQIRQARVNATRYAGIEESPEAERCRALYQRLLERGRLYRSAAAQGSDEGEEKVATTASFSSFSSPTTTTTTVDDPTPLPADLFTHDAEAVEVFEAIRDVVVSVMQRYAHDKKTKGGGTLPQERSTAERRKAKLEEAVQVLRESMQNAPSHQLAAELEKKRHTLAHRLLSIAEKDVKSELAWIKAMEEAERPPLLPVPVVEDGMSYISVSDILAWREAREGQQAVRHSPFAPAQRRQERVLEAQRRAEQRRVGSAETSADTTSRSTAGAESSTTSATALRSAGRNFTAAFLGQPWEIPNKPTLFWGTGVRAVQQALEHAAEDARYRRHSKEVLPPPYPCAVNPWGWRLVKDILDD